MMESRKPTDWPDEDNRLEYSGRADSFADLLRSLRASIMHFLISKLMSDLRYLTMTESDGVIPSLSLTLLLVHRQHPRNRRFSLAGRGADVLAIRPVEPQHVDAGCSTSYHAMFSVCRWLKSVSRLFNVPAAS